MTSQTMTGTRDEHYNAVSVLYHVLQEGETMERYIKDAREARDEELAAFFEQMQREDQERAQRAKELLKNRL